MQLLLLRESGGSLWNLLAKLFVPTVLLCGKIDGDEAMPVEASLSKIDRPVLGLFIIKLIVSFLLFREAVEPLLLFDVFFL